MRSRLTLAALALTFAIGACDRDAPTSPAAGTDNQAPPTAAAPKVARQPLIFPANQALTDPALDDGVFYTITQIQITRFAVNNDPATKNDFKLVVDGQLTYTNPATGATRTERFVNAPANLSSSGAPTQPTCQILNLDIGAIHLDLLGLVIDLAPVHLDIVAESGAGNLLGNLLCALVNLLNQQSPLLTALTDLLNTINNLLSQL